MADAVAKQTQPKARSEAYKAPTTGKGGLKRKVKASHERNKPGVPRSRKIKGDKFDANITKRGTDQATNKKQKSKEEEGPSISPLLVGVFIFLVIGSAIFQIISQSQGSLLG